MLYYAVSICHQTYALQDPSRNLYGWDYLEDGFLRMAIESPELLSADTIISFGIAELSQALLPWFSPDGTVMNSTLDRITERARLMFDAAYLLSKQFKGSVLELLASTNGWLLNNGNGYYEVLQPVEAFSDNHRKFRSLSPCKHNPIDKWKRISDCFFCKIRFTHRPFIMRHLIPSL